jgi:hypothetical protein
MTHADALKTLNDSARTEDYDGDYADPEQHDRAQEYEAPKRKDEVPDAPHASQNDGSGGQLSALVGRDRDPAIEMWRESRTPTSDRLVMLRAAHDSARDVNGTARGGPRPLIPEVMMIAHVLADLDADERDEREPADRAEMGNRRRRAERAQRGRVRRARGR